MLRRENIKQFLPAIIITIVIAVCSLWENPQVPKSVQIGDKMAHGITYTMLALAWMIPIARSLTRARVLPYIYVCMGVTAYGALIEILQRFCTFSRTGEMADLFADFIGAVIGVALAALIISIKKS